MYTLSFWPSRHFLPPGPTNASHGDRQTIPKSTKRSSKVHPNSIPNPKFEIGPKRPLGGVLRGSWHQEGPKSQKCSKNRRLVSQIGGQVGSQNPTKNDLKVIQKAIVPLLWN